MMKRFFLIIPLTFLFILVEMFNWVGLLLDELFYPGYRKVSIKSPVFIVGMPRSGNTWLQSLLSANHEVFSSMKLWEMLFAPSIIQKKFFLMLRQLDKHLYNILYNNLCKLDKLAFNKYKPMHPTSFFDYGEDDLLLIHMFSGLFLIFLFPEKKAFESLIQFDNFPEKRHNKRVILFYKKCIQKHLYVLDTHKIYLSKSPGHTPKMKYLSTYFPDSRFICTFRSPLQFIPSAISLFIRFCEIYHTPYQLNTLIDRTYAMAEYWLPHPLEIINDLPENRYIIIHYEALINRLDKVVSTIFKKFGIKLSREFYDFILHQQSLQYESKHIYSLTKYGLDADYINKRFNGIFSEYLTRSANGY